LGTCGTFTRGFCFTSEADADARDPDDAWDRHRNARMRERW
jgi:hypothetical protein